MTQTYTSETGLFVVVDPNGEVMTKADVPPGDHPIPDDADLSLTFDVTDTTDMATMLSDSPNNYPSTDPQPDTAQAKLNETKIDDKYEATI